jgi:DNA ligase-1
MEKTHRPDIERTAAPGRRALLVAASAAVLAPLAAGASGRSGGLPIPLAVDAPPRPDPRGYLVSEKYDGVRALWDGRQLRFRSAIAITAPYWFTARLPDVPLDGELWLGRGAFEALSGTVRRQQPDDGAWREVRYMVFDLPQAPGDFARRTARLTALIRGQGWHALQAVEQRAVADTDALRRRLEEVVKAGGEGLVLRRADAAYIAGRDASMLKLKPVLDAEATVVGHEPGRGRHAGRLGALRVRTDEGREFRLGTGLSDRQRSEPPPLGTRVTYAYRGLTEDGLPRFASFVRVRAIEL